MQKVYVLSLIFLYSSIGLFLLSLTIIFLWTFFGWGPAGSW